MLQSNRHHQQTNTQCFTGRMPFLSPNQQWQSTEGKINLVNKLYGRPTQYVCTPVTMTFDLLTVKVVSESHVMWAALLSLIINLLPEHKEAKNIGRALQN